MIYQLLEMLLLCRLVGGGFLSLSLSSLSLSVIFLSSWMTSIFLFFPFRSGLTEKLRIVILKMSQRFPSFHFCF